MSLKLVPAALLLFIVVAIGTGQLWTRSDAAVAGDLVASATSMTSGGTPITVTIPVGAPNPNEDVTISTLGFASADLSGTLVVVACTPDCPNPAGLGENTSDDVTPIVVTQDGLSQIVVAVGLMCTANANLTITADTATDPSEQITIGCVAPAQSGGTGNQVIPGVGQVVLTPTPNLLPCEGGTTTLFAEVIDTEGNALEDVEFRFSTDAGTIVQTSPDTAKLTLGPNQWSATVTATIFDFVGGISAVSKTANVALACNGDSLTQTLVVTASPNVVDCTGKTIITATVRDRNGHVVPGRGFHFVTDTGLLEVDPNNASTEEGKATLYLRPGDGDATVAVSSGLLLGTMEELDTSVDGEAVGNEPNFVVDETNMVTVQQNCLSTTTGQIRVNSSAATVGCGENVFIGLSVSDEDLQTVIDQTPMTLIASAGGFYGGIGEGGAQTLLPAAQVPTSHGEANTIYTAPANFNGEVKITAASGDAYGYEKINVTCVNVLPPSTGTGTGSAGAPPCTPIGDGVCITPPNTGRNFITPPSTGSAGLK